MNTYEIITIAVSLFLIVTLNPLGDAIRDNGNKRLQKTIEIFRDIAFFILIFIAPKTLTFVICFALAYLAFRIAFHNVVYNLSRKPRLPWYYIGTTSISDDVESKINKVEVLIYRIISFVFGIVILWISFK